MDTSEKQGFFNVAANLSTEESMVRMLKAEGSAAKGNQKAMDRMLRTFIRQVSEQSGRLLTSPQAVTLIQDAKSLMG